MIKKLNNAIKFAQNDLQYQKDKLEKATSPDDKQTINMMIDYHDGRIAGLKEALSLIPSRSKNK